MSYHSMEEIVASETLYCGKCNRDRINISQGVYVCDKCGETTYGFVQEYIPNVWLYQKSKHSRRRSFSKFALKYVDHQCEPGLTGDFIEVVKVLESEGLLEGRNIIRYCYYLIRLASRRGVELLKQPRDIKTNRTMGRYNGRLFGVVYPTLGWDKDCICPYYSAFTRGKKYVAASDHKRNC